MLNRLPVVVIESSIVSMRFVFRRAQYSRNQEPQEECKLHKWRHHNSCHNLLLLSRSVALGRNAMQQFAQVKNGEDFFLLLGFGMLVEDDTHPVRCSWCCTCAVTRNLNFNRVEIYVHMSWHQMFSICYHLRWNDHVLESCWVLWIYFSSSI